jgi:ribosome-associated protein
VRIGEKSLLYKKLAVAAARSAADKKAEAITVLDVRKLTAATDYFVIVTVNSVPQAQAVRNEVEDSLYIFGAELRNRRQQSSTRWMLLDFSGVIVHIFIKEARHFFNLERLWSKATKVKWESK